MGNADGSAGDQVEGNSPTFGQVFLAIDSSGCSH